MYFIYGEAELAYLRRKDKRLAAVIDRIGPVERTADPDLFSAVVHHIIGQQISMKAQATIWQRMQDTLGSVSAETILAAGVPALQALGMTFRKAEYLTDLAGRIVDGSFNLEAVRSMDDAEAIRALSSLRGIGVWTAEMILLFCLQRPDIFSYDDLAIRRGLRMVYRHRRIDRALFEKYRRRFHPYGSVASLYLWAVSGGAIPELTDPAVAEHDDLAARIVLAADEIGLTGLWFTGAKYFGAGLPASAAEADTPILAEARRWLEGYFTGQRPAALPPLHPSGSPFRRAVWDILLTIPYGETTTYGAIAQQLAAQRGLAHLSAQAVGGAVGHNPISILIPCHRVIGADGSLTGYAGGVEKKRALLELEHAKI